MKRNLLWAAVLFLACSKTVEDIPDAGGTGEMSAAQAEAMAEPLQPDPESISEYSPEALREYEQSVRFHRGEPADFDGDGRKEAVGKWVNGVFTYTIDENGDGRPDTTFDGTTHTIDFDFDGRPNVVDVTTAGKLVQETDEDQDGTLDKRITTEEVGDEERVRIEVRRSPDGPYEFESEHTEPKYKVLYLKPRTQAPAEARDIGLAACVAEMGQRFPKDIAKPYYGTKGVIIPYGRPALGRCTPEQGRKVQKALECVQHKVETCLKVLEPTIRGRMDKLLKGEGEKKTVVSCSGECDVGGITSPNFTINGRPITAVELPQGITNAPGNMACEFLFHELMHAARVPMADDHDSKGADQLYSCARFCAGCSQASVGGGDDHLDCARCASTVATKEFCGYKTKVTDRPVPDGNGESCILLSPTTVDTAPCRSLEVVALTCDDQMSRLPRSWCCEKCPDGYWAQGTDKKSGWCDGLRNPKTNGSSCSDAKERHWLCDV